MTAKIISSYYAAGYTLNAKYRQLTITQTGGVGGTGLFAGSTARVFNDGVVYGHGVSIGLELAAGGAVTNGAESDRYAMIQGADGVFITGGAGTVTNFGTIGGTGLHGDGVVITGGAGVITNFGTLAGIGADGFGVVLGAGGVVTNGATDKTTAWIEGYVGIELLGAGTVDNFGAILGRPGEDASLGVELGAGGGVTNGAASDRGAVIDGYMGVTIKGGAGTVSNFGTIRASGRYGLALALDDGGTVTNGSGHDATALIAGYEGVTLSGVGTVRNFGTIEGMGGVAVIFGAASDVLIVQAGAAFDGAVLGGGGTLDLATGVGELGLSAGGYVSVSGSMALTTFTAFGTLEIGAKATFATTGAVIVAAGETVTDAGSLTLGAAKTATLVNAGRIEAVGSGAVTIRTAVANTGTLATSGGTTTVKGAVMGGGVAVIGAGTLDFKSSFAEDVTFSAASGVLELAKSQSYTGTITGFSKTGGTSFDLSDIGFVSMGEATYSGTKSGGVLTVTDGTRTAKIHLTGDYRTSTFVAASDGHGGVIIHDPLEATASAPSHAFVAAMAGLSGDIAPGAMAPPPRAAPDRLLVFSPPRPCAA